MMAVNKVDSIRMILKCCYKKGDKISSSNKIIYIRSSFDKTNQ